MQRQLGAELAPLKLKAVVKLLDVEIQSDILFDDLGRDLSISNIYKIENLSTK